MSHTPGPFLAHAPRNDDELLEIVGKDGHIVATIPDAVFGAGPTEAERIANIALLVAAPDMKSALRLALSTLGSKGGPTAAERDGAMASIRIALRKAEPVKTGS